MLTYFLPWTTIVETRRWHAEDVRKVADEMAKESTLIRLLRAEP